MVHADLSLVFDFQASAIAKESWSEKDFEEGSVAANGQMKMPSSALNVNEMPPPISLNAMRSYLVSLCLLVV